MKLRCCLLRLLIYWLVAENVAAISCSIECQVSSPKCCLRHSTTTPSVAATATISPSSSKIENDNKQLMIVAGNMPQWWCLHVMPTQEAWHYDKNHRHVRHVKSVGLVEMEPEETRIDEPFTIFRPANPKTTKQPESQHKDYDEDDQNYDDDDEEDEDDYDNEDDDNDDDENEDDDDVDDDDEEVDQDANAKASKKKIRQRQRRKRKRIRQKKPQTTQHVSLGQPANLLLASLTSLPTPPPYHQHHEYSYNKPIRKKPDKAPIKHIKYMLHKGGLLKKKKQEYLSHLGYVFLPFVKFVAFFTILNPFTLAVFFFMLISPLVFGLLGFTALSLILRPLMNLVFAVKHRVGDINRRKYRYQRHKRPSSKTQQRPITIHKHYYQQPLHLQHQHQQQHQQNTRIPLNAHRIPLTYLGPHRRNTPANISYHLNPILPHVQNHLLPPPPMFMQLRHFEATTEIT